MNVGDCASFIDALGFKGDNRGRRCPFRARDYHMSINKVAKLAGVSSSTVSRVINNHPRVAPDTAQNVRKAMQELNYTPSDRRPGPKPSFRSRTGVANIAFLVLGTSRSRATPAFEFLLRGVSTGASRNDLNLIFNH